MNTITGDLIQLAKDGRFDIIVHGCNCFCTMNKGIAKQIAANFHLAKITDQRTLPGDRTKLGTIVPNRANSNAWNRLSDLWVVNAYTQYDYRGSSSFIS
jgi:O-acetyl-ADP-ribose deacetylase (regulator of RNase III)